MTMRSKALLFAAFLAVLTVSAPAFAGRALTFSEALALGLKDNPGIRAAGNSAEAASAEIGIARSRLLPRITVEERLTATDNPTLAFSSKLNQERFESSDFAIGSLNDPEAIHDFRTSLSFEQPLYAPKARIGVEMAREEHTARLHGLSRKREEVAFEILKGFLAISTLSEQVEAAKKGVEEAREHLRLANVRHDNRMGLYSDVLRATAGLAEAEQRLTSAQKNLQVSRLSLGLSIGIDEPVETRDAPPELGLKGLDHYLSSALSRSDLKSMTLRRNAARQGIEAAESGWLPQAGVGGAYMLNGESPLGADGRSWQVEAFIKWDVFDGSLRRHESAKARHSEAEAAEHLEGMKKGVAFKVRAAYLAVGEASRNLELSEKALAAAEEGLRIVRTRYENSLSPMVDLLDAEAALNGARANRITKKNELKAAVASLSFESGTLLKELGVAN